MTPASAKRKKIPSDVKLLVLTESGYRCAVPTCRQILAIDLHHLDEVSEGGGDGAENLVALCPTCHALFHRGTIQREALFVYKSLIVSLLGAFDHKTIDLLLFLDCLAEVPLIVSGDGTLTASRLIAAGLASVILKANNANQLVTYQVSLTSRGSQLVAAWKSGDRSSLAALLGESSAD